MPITKSIQQTQAKARRRQRATIYHTPRWRATRAIVLARAQHQCALCHEQATIADHWPLPLQTILDHGHDPYAPDACRALCNRCSGTVDGGRT